jgi:Ca2+-transporting ATPase
VPALYRNSHTTRSLEQWLAQQPGILGVTANSRTGNALVLFGPTLSVEEVLNLVSHLASPPGPRTALRGYTIGDSRDRSSPGDMPSHSPDIGWHTLSHDSVLSRLDTGRDGLSTNEAQRRFRQYGPNELDAAVERPLADIVVGQFKSIPVLLLMGSAVLSVVTGGLADAAVIVGVIGINAAVAPTREQPPGGAFGP